MQERPSANFDDRIGDRSIDMLVLHYTGMASAAAALDRLCAADASVSAHYVIDEDGTGYRLVAEDKRAWHAGRAWWWGDRDVNSCSIGIELVNPGHEFGYRPFPEDQMQALEDLAADIVARHDIPPERVLGHSDVAPERKRDPGELLDWRRLADRGIALWPGEIAAIDAPALKLGDVGIDVVALQSGLARYGYRLDPTGVFNVQTERVVTAFQRHFRPAALDGVADPETGSILASLLAIIAADRTRSSAPAKAEPSP